MVTNAMSMITGSQRMHGNELKRDNEALNSFYGPYKERYDKCENNESIEALKNIIASNLYRLSMDVLIILVNLEDRYRFNDLSYIVWLGII